MLGAGSFAKGEPAMKIQDIVNKIWSNPKISEDEILADINVLSEDQKSKLVILHKTISEKGSNQDELLKILRDNELLLRHENELSEASESLGKLRDVLVAFYLSEYRLDDYAYYPSKMKQNLFNDALGQWKLKKDFIMPIYLNWGHIKHLFLALW